MTFIQKIKKQSTYGHLPNFGVFSKNKLYLPNSSISHCILGKWSLEWIDSDRCLIGLVEQDQFSNITFKITSCYEFLDNEELKLISLSEFTEYWSRVYTYDSYLSLIHITVSEYYQSNGTVTPQKVIKANEAPNAPIKQPVEHKIILGSPPKSPRFAEVKEEVKTESGFKVCKTDKPDVYHVYQNSKYSSTCLIPNMKTSRYMQDLFENKNIGETVHMNMKLHEKTGKYYPNL
jgi:hypothetical protein